MAQSQPAPVSAVDDKPSARRLRLVVVAKPCAENEPLLAGLGQVGDVVKVIVPIDPPEPPRQKGWLRERLWGSPGRTLVRVARRAVFRWLDARLQSDVRRRLPEVTTSGFDDALSMSRLDLNGDAGEALLRELAPDLMVLSVAPMIKARIYRIPLFGTVNLHWGIAPQYRGVDSIATALRRHDYANIGATLHFVDDRSDTGRVVAQAWPHMQDGDDTATITAKISELGARMLCEFISRIAIEPVPGCVQSGSGELVRYRDRRLRHHLRLFLDRHFRRRRPPFSPERLMFSDGGI